MSTCDTKSVVALAEVARSLRMWRMAIAIAMGIPSGVLGYWASDRSLPFEIIGHATLPDPAYPGDSIDIGWRVKTYRHGCHTTFRRTITDPIAANGEWLERMDHTSGYGDLEIGPIHQMHTTQPFVLPPVSSGKAPIQIIFKAHCNPLHEWWPIEFRGTAIVNVGKKP